MSIQLSLLKSLINKTDYLRCETKSPSYVWVLSQLTDIILIYNKPIDVFRRSKTQREDSCDDDLTGNPLECPFNLNYTFEDTVCIEPKQLQEEEWHFPISGAEARAIWMQLNDLCLRQPSILDSRPIYLLSDGDDGIVLRARTTDDPGWVNRSWCNALPSERSPFNITSMVGKHDSIANIQCRKAVCSVSCVCNISGPQYIPVMDRNGQEAMVDAGVVRLQFRWKKPSVAVPEEAETMLMVDCNVGNAASKALALWQQLLLIQRYVITIRSATKDENGRLPSDTVLPSGGDVTWMLPKKAAVLVPRSLKDRIVSAFQTQDRRNLQAKGDLDAILTEVTATDTAMELTDKLWDLLISGCSTYKELCSAFEIIFHQHPCSTQNVMIHNRSRMGPRLQGGTLGNATLPLSPDSECALEPLEMLVEMGLEKLHKCYSLIFSLSAMTAQSISLVRAEINHLPSFVGGRASRWLGKADAWLTCLARLHAVLEVAALSQSALAVPSVVLAPMVRRLLQLYLAPDSPITSLSALVEAPHQVVAEEPLSKADVSLFLSEDTPFASWKMQLESESPHKRVKSVFYRSIESLFPAHFNRPEMSIAGEMTVVGPSLDEAISYYSYEMFTISSKMN